MKHHFFIGIDRSDQTIDIALLDSKGQLIKQDKVDSSPESLQLLSLIHISEPTRPY